MAKKNPQRMIIWAVYAAILAAIVWQGLAIAGVLNPGRMPMPDEKTLRVTVEGNVKKPGMYMVPEGTTQYEILKVAGVQSTSDLSTVDQSTPVEDNNNLRIGTLSKPVDSVASSPAQPSGQSSGQPTVNVEYYFGDMNIISMSGRTVPPGKGISLTSGDRVITGASSQAELSLNGFSKIDVDNYSELVFDQIGTAQNPGAIQMFQRAGTCLYNIVYGKREEKCRIATTFATISVGGTGANFTIDTKADQVQVNATGGLLLIERTGGKTESLNLIAGQSVTIYNDGRPFQVTGYTPDAGTTEKFSKLVHEKTNFITSHQPFNFLFVGPPLAYYVISVQFEKSLIMAIRIPPKLLVTQFVHGFSTIDQSLLYEGPLLMSSIAERILNTSIEKYCLFDRRDIVRTVGAVGGVDLDVDPIAASRLHIPMGRQKLKQDQVAHYLSPFISGPEDAARRQKQVLEGMFEALKSKSIIVNSILAQAIFQSVETNITAADVMGQYAKFIANPNWKFKEVELPAIGQRWDNYEAYDPDLDLCRKLLSDATR